MAFSAFDKEPAQRASLQRERQIRRAAEPHAKWQYVNVTFTSANVDTPVAHALQPTNPEDVRYQVVRQGAAAIIYDDESPTRRPWIKGVIFLRASVATTARILLFLEQNSTAPDFIVNSGV